MATNGGEIKFRVGFDVNKAGLDNLEKTLSHLKGELGKQIDFSKSLKTDEANKKLVEVQTTINEVQKALRDSFNSDLGVMNVTKLNSALKGIGIDKIQKDFSTMGAAGQIAFKNIAAQALTTNMQLKQTHKLVDKMAETLGNTLKWNISSGAINKMTGAIQEAWGFTKSLDGSLNDIMIVTGKNADEMERFAKNANKAAKELSAGTTDYTKASLIYYQQGLSDEETAARAETTVKVANVTGQNTDTVSENLTAVWNGYKVSAEEAELYIDKLSAVAATTAADLDGLSTGMSKVASAANIMGVDVDQLNATLATVISVTQQAPETVGTAFKTIYARMGDIEAGIDSETTLGAYTSEMKEIAGVSVLDANGELREMGEVIEEVGGKWNTLSREQQIALSQVMAGTRQYNNLLSLFDNWDMYTKTLEESANAAGTLQEQQDIYQQSVEATLQELRTAYEGLYMSLADTDSIKDMAEMLTFAIERVTDFTEALGGGKAVLSALGAVATRVFSKQIAQGIMTTITNFKIAKDNAAQVTAQFQTIELFGGRQNIASGYLEELTKMKKSVLELGDLVTNEQHEQANSIIKTTNELQNQKIAYDESVKQAQEFLHNNLDYRSSKGNQVNLYEKEDKNGNIDYTEDFDPSSAEKANAALKKIKGNIEDSNDAIFRAKVAIKEYSNSIEDNGKKHTQTKQKLQEAVGKIKEEIETVQKLNTNLKESSSIRKEYQQRLDDANAAYNEALQKRNKNAILRTGQELLNIHTEINEKMSKEAEKTGEVIAQQAENTGQKIQKNIKDAKDSWENFIKNLQSVKNIQSFVQILGGINQITSGLQSLANIAKIINNDDLSFGEKAIQIVSALAMGTSMLLSGALTLGTVIPPLLVQLKLLKIEQLENATAGQVFALSLKSLGTAGVAAIKKLGLAIKSLATAHPAILAITVALGALVTAYSFAIEHEKEMRENALENAKADLEEVKAKQEKLKVTEELTDNYAKLYQQYKETGKASEEFKTVTDDVIEALNIQDVAVLKLTGDYEELTKKILENKRVEIEKQKEEAEKGVKSSEDIISGQIYENGGSISPREILTQTDYFSPHKERAVIDLGFSLSDEAKIDFQKYLENFNLEFALKSNGQLYIHGNENMSSVEFYQNLLEIEKQIKEDYNKDEYEKSEFYDYLHDIKGNDELKEAYESWQEQSKLLEEAISELKIYEGDLIYEIPEITTQEEYQEKKAEVKEKLEDTDKYSSEEELENTVITVFSSYLTPEKVKNYENRIDFSEEVGKQLISLWQHPFDYNLPKIEKEIEKEIADLSDAEFTTLTAIVDIDKIKSEKILDDYIKYAKAKTKVQDINLKISVIEDLENGKKITDLTEEQQQALKDLESEYGILQSIQDKSSKEYIKSLLQVQQELEEVKIEQEEIATDVLIGYALELDVNTDEFEETMKDIAEQQYEVLVAVKADVQSDFDNLVNNMDDISNIASKIGDDFIVAASDLEELNDVFPGILANMELTEDGSVKLNSTITKEAIEAAKNQIKADTATTIEKLNNQAKEMEVKRDAARNVANILRSTLEAETITGKKEEELDNALNQLKSDNSESIAEQEQQDAIDVGETSAKVATEMTNNFAGAYQNMSENAKEWARIAQEALRASTDVNADLPEIGTFSGASFETTVAIKESEKAELKSAEDVEVLSKEEREELAQYYDNLANSWDEAVNNTYGKVAEALARENENLNKLNNIQSGKGSDGQKSKDNIEYLNKEVDLYREVNLEIAKQEKLLSKLEKEQDKLGGKELIDNLNKQLDAIEKQNLALERKIEIGKKEAQALRNSLSKEGVSFGEDGYISNYQAMLNYKEDYLRRVTEKYNLLSEAEQKEYKHYVDEAQKDYDNFKEDMDRYTDLVSEELPDWAEEIKDNLDKEVEIQIKTFNYEVELTLDLSEAKRQWDDFKRDVILNEDDSNSLSQSYLDDLSIYENNALIASNKAMEVQREIDIMNAGGVSSIYGNNINAAIEDLEKWHNEAMSSVQAAKNAAEQSRQLWLSGIDESIGELDKTAEVYDTLASLYNHDMNMVTMLYGEDEYEKMEKIYAQRQANDMEELNNIKEREKYYKRMMDAETDPEAKEKWEKAWLATINELTSKTEEAVKTVLDKHANAVKKVIEEINEKLLPKGTDLDFLGQEWDLIQESSNRYLDDIEAGFGIQDLKNAFDDAFDTTDAISGQSKLNKLYEEQMNILREKDKLSQYDLDRAQAMLDITLKEIALEEARQNKSSMRLRRDSQGNYSYQYVEDEEATSNAEKELQDAKENLYKLDKEKYLEDVKYVYDKYKEVMDEIDKIGADATLSVEEREKKKALLIEQYGPLIKAATADVESGKERLAESTQLALETIGDEIVDDFIGKEGVGTLPELESGIATFVDNLSKEGGMKEVLETTFDKLDGILDDTEQSIKDIEKAAGEDFDAIGTTKDDVDGLKTSVDGLKINLDKLIKSEEKETEVLKKLHTRADTRLKDLTKINGQIMTNITSTQSYIEAMKQAQIEGAKLAGQKPKASPSSTPTKTPASKGAPLPKEVPEVDKKKKNSSGDNDKDKGNGEELPDNPSDTPKNISKTPKYEPGRTVRFTGSYLYEEMGGYLMPWTPIKRDTYYNNVGYIPAKIIKSKNKRHFIEIDKRFAEPDHPNTGWVTEDTLQYKTGGLVNKTGLAWLDGTKSKPELVLNSSDTPKLLEAAKLLRNVDDLAKSLEDAVSVRMSNRLSKEYKVMSEMMKITAIEKTSPTPLEQNVHIDADFPNVSDSREIEMAFENLINVASQYAYQNR